MTLRLDEQGRPLALVAYSADQARAPEGAANGGQWVSDDSDQTASQSDDEAKRMYADLLNLPPEQRAAYLAKLSPDQLTRLGKFASTGKEAKGPIADIKTAVGNAMASRGLDPKAAGLKSKGGAKKKAGAKKSGGSGSKSGGGKSAGGGSKGGGSKKSSGGSSKKSGGSSSKSSGSKSSGSTKTPAKTTPKPAKPTPPPAPPEVKPIGLPGRPGARPTPGPPSTQPVRPAGRVGKRRRKPTTR